VIYQEPFASPRLIADSQWVPLEEDYFSEQFSHTAEDQILSFAGRTAVLQFHHEIENPHR
jgi:hypothetical protein